MSAPYKSEFPESDECDAAVRHLESVMKDYFAPSQETQAQAAVVDVFLREQAEQMDRALCARLGFPNGCVTEANASVTGDSNLNALSFIKEILSKVPSIPTKIIASDSMLEQFRFPKSRKKRIRNKWAKRPENWRPARQGYYMAETNTVYVHSEIYEQIKNSMPR